MDRTATGIVIQRSKSWTYQNNTVPQCSSRENHRDFAVRCGFIGAYRVYGQIAQFDCGVWKRRANEQPASDPKRNENFLKRLAQQTSMYHQFLLQICTDAVGYQIDLLPGYRSQDEEYRKDEFQPEYLMRKAWRDNMNGMDNSMNGLESVTIDPGTYMIVAEHLRNKTEVFASLQRLEDHYGFMMTTLEMKKDFAVRAPKLESIHTAAVYAINSRTELPVSAQQASSRVQTDRSERLALAGVSLTQFGESSEFIDKMIRSEYIIPETDEEIALRQYHNEISQLCEYVGVPFSYVTKDHMKHFVNKATIERRKAVSVQDMLSSPNSMAIIDWYKRRANFFKELSEGVGVQEKSNAGGVSSIKLQYHDTNTHLTDQSSSGVKRKFQNIISE